MALDHSDLDEAFTEFWIRFENKPYTGGPLAWFGQSSIAIDYYLALSYAIDKDDKSNLHLLLTNKVPIPIEFLPIISGLFIGRISKGGPKPQFTTIEKVNLCWIMDIRQRESGVDIKKIAVNLSQEMDELTYKLGPERLEDIYNETLPLLTEKMRTSKE